MKRNIFCLLTVFVLGAVLASATMKPEKIVIQNVLQLTDDNFDEATSEFKYVIVFFYTTWWYVI